MTRVFLGLGSNLGNRLEYLQQAIGLLEESPGVMIVRVSSVYETEPVGFKEQGRFYNAVTEIETSLSPRDLLKLILDIELRLGRVRTRPWGPRTIDLDILLYGDEVIEEPDMIIPHPRMVERAFVLIPLLEIWPEAHLPGGKKLADISIDQEQSRGIKKVYEPTWYPRR